MQPQTVQCLVELLVPDEFRRVDVYAVTGSRRRRQLGAGSRFYSPCFRSAATCADGVEVCFHRVGQPCVYGPSVFEPRTGDSYWARRRAASVARTCSALCRPVFATVFFYPRHLCAVGLLLAVNQRRQFGTMSVVLRSNWITPQRMTISVRNLLAVDSNRVLSPRRRRWQRRQRRRQRPL